MTIHARVFDVDTKTRKSIAVREGATLAETLAAVDVAVNPERALSQNGRPAKGTDRVRPGAVVTQMPLAGHG